MIEISIWDTKNSVAPSITQSIVDDVVFRKIECGYEVFIDFKHRRWSINSWGSGGFEVPTHNVTVIDDNEVWHTVRYEVPEELENLGYMRLSQKQKNQLTIYYIDYKLLNYADKEVISKYECPQSALRSVLWKLEL